MTCSIPGMCSRDPGCRDTRCPGHPGATLPHRLDALDMARLQGFLHTSEGGRRVSGCDSVRTEPKPTESATARSDAISRVLLVIAAAAALAVVLSQLPL